MNSKIHFLRRKFLFKTKLQHPFSGPNAISPNEFYRVLELWKTDSLKSPQ
jgi:hypothetical protein